MRLNRGFGGRGLRPHAWSGSGYEGVFLLCLPDHAMPIDAAIQTEKLTKHFGTTIALNGIGLTVRRGAICGLLGPNGGENLVLLARLLGFRGAALRRRVETLLGAFDLVAAAQRLYNRKR